MKKSVALGLVSGLVFVVLTMVVVALVNLPEAEGAVAADASRVRCPTVQVAQDQGYGISRTVTRRSCESAVSR